MKKVKQPLDAIMARPEIYSQQDVDDMIDANRAVSFRWGVLVGMIVSPCLFALGWFVAWAVRL